MHSTITIMNAKGGVGKSTLTLTLAETLAACHGKRVLVVDSDAHASVSTMLMRPDWVQAIQTQGRTMVDYFIAVVLKNEFVNWTAFVSGGVSDVDDARTVDLMTGGGHLTLFEREVSKEGLESRLRHAVRSFLTEARNTYDFVFIDSAPGLSVLTECWLREVDFFVSPSKPDYISTHGLQFLGQFSQRDSDMGFAECLGVIISMKDINAFEDAQYERWLRKNSKHPCFDQVIPRATSLQTAAHFSPRPRSYWAKYPGETGKALRQLAAELLVRNSAALTRKGHRQGRAAE
ncbi:MAG TPA: ParA family protein [Hyphomicrobiaceae bacterium]|jgi:chromosome partitioning protein|nr:ParA family protein [Hyphomicrobiaceae bacterium]